MISIHALREEGDHTDRVGEDAVNLFLSTPSARRATHGNAPHRLQAMISIHALREEGDIAGASAGISSAISIHALREEGDTTKPHTSWASWTFLSTPSARRATCQKVGKSKTAVAFLSTPSARRATQIAHLDIPAFRFLSTPSARRATLCSGRCGKSRCRFLSTPSARRATYIIVIS